MEVQFERQAAFAGSMSKQNIPSWFESVWYPGLPERNRAAPVAGIKTVVAAKILI
jgi:hypothetical protein